MKIYYVLFLLFIFFSYKITAQNWQAISPQHIYNYQVNADINPFYNTKINTMVNVFVDSIITSNGNITQYALNTVFDREVPENGQYQIIHQPQFLQKEMWVQNDTFFFQNPANTKMIPTKAQIGQTWLFDATQNITANVVDIQATTTFGQADSLKIMVLSTNDTLILSKAFGIIRFPFAYNSPYFYQLVGINDLHLGTTVPMFEDIFNFEVGDMFEYEIRQDNPLMSVFDIKKYEITSKNYANGIYSYEIMGNIKHSAHDNGVWWEVTYNAFAYTETYKDSSYFSNVNHYNYQLYEFMSYNFAPAHVLAATTIADSNFMGYFTILRNPTRYIVDCNTHGISNQMPDTVCNAQGQSGFFFEHGENVIAGKGLGFIHQTWTTYPEWGSTELVAFKKNGITYGTFTPDSLLIAGIENSQNASFYQVFPNPTTSNITLLFDKDDSYEAAIYNLLGEKMSSFSIQNKKEEVIDLQNFQSGMYYLQVVNTKGKRSVQKIVKN